VQSTPLGGLKGLETVHGEPDFYVGCWAGLIILPGRRPGRPSLPRRDEGPGVRGGWQPFGTAGHPCPGPEPGQYEGPAWLRLRRLMVGPTGAASGRPGLTSGLGVGGVIPRPLFAWPTVPSRPPPSGGGSQQPSSHKGGQAARYKMGRIRALT